MIVSRGFGHIFVESCSRHLSSIDVVADGRIGDDVAKDREIISVFYPRELQAKSALEAACLQPPLLLPESLTASRNAGWVASMPPSMTAKVMPVVSILKTRCAASALTVARDSKSVCAAALFRLIRKMPFGTARGPPAQLPARWLPLRRGPEAFCVFVDLSKQRPVLGGEAPVASGPLSTSGVAAPVSVSQLGELLYPCL